jgi:hypothetical protein
MEKMRKCADDKMYNRPPLLEEPFAQTLSGKNFGMPISGVTEANNKYLQNFTNTNLQIV